MDKIDRLNEVLSDVNNLDIVLDKLLMIVADDIADDIRKI